MLLPGHTFLYSPPVLKIRDLIRAGTLGDIYFVSTSRVNLGLHQTDASVVWDLGPHDFSILQFWLEETPTMVSAISRNCIMPGTPDVTFINLEYASETIAQVELSWLAPSKLRRTTIVGSEAMVVYDDTSNEPVRVFDSGVSLPDPSSFGEYRLSYRTGDIVSPRIPVAEPLALELADFCTAIRTATAPHCTAQLGVEVVRVIEAVDASLATGQRVALSPAGDHPAGPTDRDGLADPVPRAVTSLRPVSIPVPEHRAAGHHATARATDAGHEAPLRADAARGSHMRSWQTFLRDGRAVFRRHWKLLVLPIPLALAITIWVVVSTPTMYQSQAAVWSNITSPQAAASAQAANGAIPLTRRPTNRSLLDELLATNAFRTTVATTSPLAGWLQANPPSRLTPSGLTGLLHGTPALTERIRSALLSGTSTTLNGPQVMTINFSAQTPDLARDTLQAMLATFAAQRAELVAQSQGTFQVLDPASTPAGPTTGASKRACDDPVRADRGGDRLAAGGRRPDAGRPARPPGRRVGSPASVDRPRSGALARHRPTAPPPRRRPPPWPPTAIRPPPGRGRDDDGRALCPVPGPSAGPIHSHPTGVERPRRRAGRTGRGSPRPSTRETTAASDPDPLGPGCEGATLMRNWQTFLRDGRAVFRRHWKLSGAADPARATDHHLGRGVHAHDVPVPGGDLVRHHLAAGAASAQAANGATPLTPAAQQQSLLNELLATNSFRTTVATTSPLAAWLQANPPSTLTPSGLTGLLARHPGADRADPLDPAVGHLDDGQWPAGHDGQLRWPSRRASPTTPSRRCSTPSRPSARNSSPRPRARSGSSTRRARRWVRRAAPPRVCRRS